MECLQFVLKKAQPEDTPKLELDRLEDDLELQEETSWGYQSLTTAIHHPD
jgi:hypothetical protein